MHLFRTLRTLRALSFLPALWCGAALAATPLIGPAQLQSLQATGAVRIVDVREGPAYALQHLPGAVSAPYGLWRGPATNPGALVPLAQLTALVQQLGLTPQTPTVIVYTGTDSTEFGSAARVYWTLKSLGAQELSILNGGLAAWKAAGLPVSNQASMAPASHWQPQWDARWTATREALAQQLATQPPRLIDARPKPYFDGRKVHDAARAAGTLPGAISLDSDLFFEPGSSALMGKDDLDGEAQSARADGNGPTVTFCNTGHWAATDWFVLSEILGQTDVKMYPGSMIDWTLAPRPLPMVNEPGRLAQLRYQVLNWAHRNLGTAAP